MYNLTFNCYLYIDIFVAYPCIHTDINNLISRTEKHMISRNWKRENIAWLAGIVEGEGYISASPARINVNMCDKDVIDKILFVSGCGSITGPLQPKNKRHKPSWRWQVSTEKHSYALLVVILPYLCERRSKSAVGAIASFLSKPTRQSKHTHGTRASYKAGCKCRLCLDAVSIYQKTMKNNKNARIQQKSTA
jgi:hypothetical protein